MLLLSLTPPNIANPVFLGRCLSLLTCPGQCLTSNKTPNMPSPAPLTCVCTLPTIAKPVRLQHRLAYLICLGQCLRHLISRLVYPCYCASEIYFCAKHVQVSVPLTSDTTCQIPRPMCLCRRTLHFQAQTSASSLLFHTYHTQASAFSLG